MTDDPRATPPPLRDEDVEALLRARWRRDRDAEPPDLDLLARWLTSDVSDEERARAQAIADGDPELCEAIGIADRVDDIEPAGGMGDVDGGAKVVPLSRPRPRRDATPPTRRVGGMRWSTIGAIAATAIVAAGVLWTVGDGPITDHEPPSMGAAIGSGATDTLSVTPVEGDGDGNDAVSSDADHRPAIGAPLQATVTPAAAGHLAVFTLTAGGRVTDVVADGPRSRAVSTGAPVTRAGGELAASAECAWVVAIVAHEGFALAPVRATLSAAAAERPGCDLPPLAARLPFARAVRVRPIGR